MRTVSALFAARTLRPWLLIALAVVVAAGMSVSADARPMRLSFATTMDDSGIDYEITRKFQSRLEELSDGQMVVDLFMAGTMGGETEALEMLKLGELDLGYNVVQASLYYNEYNVTQVPFLFPDIHTIRRFFEETEVGLEIQEILRREGGLEYLGMHDYGPRWTTSSRPFSNAEELKGLKIRMPNIPIWVDVWAGMGALPTPIAAPEIMTALKTGTVDAQENFLTNIVGRRMWEVQDYLIATEHVMLPQQWLASSRLWNRLNDEQRAWIRQAVRDAIAHVEPMVEEMNEEFVREAREAGMNIIYPDRDSLLEAAMPTINHILEYELAPGVYEAALEVLDL